MPRPLMVGMTDAITVEGAYIIRITALDATTGNAVAGVKVSQAALIAADISEPDTSPTVTLKPGMLP